MTPTTVTELVGASFARVADAEALRFRGPEGEWVAWTYAELDRRVERVARGLAASGVRHGDRVALLSDTRPEWTVVDLAIARAGAVSVPLHHVTTRAECEHVLSHSGARALVAETAEHVALGRAAAVGGGAWASTLVAIAAPGHDALSLEALAARGDDWGGELPAVAPEDCFTIIYTSGTTGTPKGCVHTHATYAAAMRMTAELGSIVEGDLSFLSLPLAHVFGREVQTLTLAVGGCVAYLGGDRSKLFDELAEVRPTFFASVPRIYEQAHARALERLTAAGLALDADAIQAGLAARLDGHAVDDATEAGAFAIVREVFGGRLREAWSGAAPIDRPVLELLFAAGVPVYEGYGLTETAAASTLGTAGQVRVGAAGRPLPGVEVRLEDGEVAVRGPNVFRGYYRDAAATAVVLRDGWLRTGDLGALDDDGYLWITGRLKDVIITSGGKNVVPGGWEDELRRSSWVDEVVVLGDRRPFLVALVVPDFAVLRARAEHRSCSDAELAGDPAVETAIAAAVEAANASRPRWSHVRRFLLLDAPLSRAAGELTATGKVRRSVVAARHAERVDALYVGE